jgi:hypothetical protein
VSLEAAVRAHVERRWSPCRDEHAIKSGKRSNGPWCAAHDSYWPSGAEDCREFTDRLDDAEALLLDPALLVEALADGDVEKQERWGTRKIDDGTMYWWRDRAEAQEVINDMIEKRGTVMELVHERRLVSDWKEVPS